MIIILHKCSAIEIYILFFLSIISGLLPIISIYAMINLADLIASRDSNLSEFIVNFLLVLTPYIGGWLIETIQEILQIRIATHSNLLLGEQIRRKMTEIDYRYRERQECKDAESRAQYAVEGDQLLSVLQIAPQFLSIIISIFSLSLIVISANVFIFIFYLLVFIFVIKYRAKAVSQLMQSLQNETLDTRINEELYSHLTTMNKRAELKIFNAEKWMIQKWKKQHEKCLTLNKNRTMTNRTKFSLSTLLGTGITNVVSIGVLVITNTLTIANAIKLIQSSMLLNSKLSQLSNNLSSTHQIYETLRFYFTFSDIDKYADIKDERMTESSAGISLNNISFSYDDNGKPALRNISTTIRPGEKIAIVGKNGAGKTTLIKTILGLYKPLNGTISYYDENGQFAPQEQPRITGTFQDYHVYRLTLREEVALSEISRINEDHSIISSLETMGLSGIMEKENLDMQLGAQFGGSELSGGQWQRLALARALFKENCSFLVFDEPMAALDVHTENRIIHHFLNISQDKTAIFITHRLSSIAHVDRILMMDQGEIIEEGTHTELLMLRGKYYEFYNAQAELYV